MSSAVADASGSVPGSSLGPADDRPLTDQEYQLLQRLLSDPFSFPAPFKAWLVSYLETSDMNLPISAINGLAGILGITGIGSGTLGIFPAGIILPFGGPAAPTGSLLCDGASYDTTVQNRLFTAIGYRYGGSGSNFNVPDYRGRSPVGLGTHADVNALGKSDGLPVANRSPIHNSQVNDPGHSHGAGASSNDSGHNHGYISPNGSGNYSGGGGFGNQARGTDIGIANISTSVSVSGAGTGVSVGPGGTRPSDQVPFEVCNFIIVN